MRVDRISIQFNHLRKFGYLKISSYSLKNHHHSSSKIPQLRSHQSHQSGCISWVLLALGSRTKEAACSWAHPIMGPHWESDKFKVTRRTGMRRYLLYIYIKIIFIVIIIIILYYIYPTSSNTIKHAQLPIYWWWCLFKGCKQIGIFHCQLWRANCHSAAWPSYPSGFLLKAGKDPRSLFAVERDIQNYVDTPAI